MVNNRNKPCWCGSGTKYKYCHLGREEKEPQNPWEAIETVRSSKQKLCCVPSRFPKKCEGKIIKAHTVSKSSSLKKIAKNGHVYKVLPDMSDIYRSNGKTTPKLEGINIASTFTGFCSFHDQQLFSPIENSSFNWDKEQLFLIAYRAFCYEWYAKNNVSKMEELYKSLDSGRPLRDQLGIQFFLNNYFIGIKAAIADQEVYKNLLDDILITKDFSKIRYIGFEFDKPPAVMGTGGFCPLEDLSGDTLQDLGDLSKTPQPIYYSSFSSEERGIFCLVWLDGFGDACERYAKSFLEFNDEDKPHEMVSILFNQSENLFLSPDWWEKLPEDQKENLNARFIQNGSLHQNKQFQTLNVSNWKVVKTKHNF